MTWVGNVWFPQAKQWVYTSVTTAMASHIDTLKKATPVWGHMITTAKYNVSLVRKHLLDTGMSEQLESAVDNVFHLASSITELYDSLGDKEAGDANATLSEAEGLLTHAREAMIVIASVNLVEVLSKTQGAKASSDAAKVLLEKKCLPDSLRAKLKAIEALNR